MPKRLALVVCLASCAVGFLFAGITLHIYLHPSEVQNELVGVSVISVGAFLFGFAVLFIAHGGDD